MLCVSFDFNWDTANTFHPANWTDCSNANFHFVFISGRGERKKKLLTNVKTSRGDVIARIRQKRRRGEADKENREVETTLEDRGRGLKRRKHAFPPVTIWLSVMPRVVKERHMGWFWTSAGGGWRSVRCRRPNRREPVSPWQPPELQVQAHFPPKWPKSKKKDFTGLFETKGKVAIMNNKIHKNRLPRLWP